MNLKKLMAASVASVMAVGTMAVAASAADYAGLIFQTNPYGFRNSIGQSSGIWWDPDFGDAMDYDDWAVSDVELVGDGQYTVSFQISQQDDNASAWNFLKLQTTLPLADYPDVKITIDSLKVDGNEVAGGTNGPVINENLDAKDTAYGDGYHGLSGVIVDAYGVNFYNMWASDPALNVVDATSSYGAKVEVTFTISGLGSADNGNAGDGTANDNNTVGDTTTTTTDKTSADTGGEGVAVVAGIAVLATGAIIVAKKRK